MRDLLDILGAVRANSGPSTLATVVRVEGSSYRSPGARMWVDGAGRRVGSVSGGCLEADVARRGRLLTADRPVVVVRYDSTDDDAAWGYGLGCNGAIDVLIERVAGPDDAGLGYLRRCVATRSAGAMVTVFATGGDCGLAPGTRLTAGGDPTGLSAMFPQMSIDLTAGKTFAATYATTGGRVDALVEAIRPPMPLVVFGAGHDAVPLTRLAKQLGWHVTVWDRRAGHARVDRFPDADVVVHSDSDDVANTVPLSADTVAVVMNHSYPDDAAVVATLLKNPVRYVGVLGPRARTDRMLSEIDRSSDAVFGPVGLDLGADGPEQVAVAVVAEILAVTCGRGGGPLRDRSGPIHQRSA